MNKAKYKQQAGTNTALLSCISTATLITDDLIKNCQLKLCPRPNIKRSLRTTDLHESLISAIAPLDD